MSRSRVRRPIERIGGLLSMRTPPHLLAAVRARILLLVAPDPPGVNQLQDATALRGPDRDHAARALRAEIRVIGAGHCLHRDTPNDWIKVITAFTADRHIPARHRANRKRIGYRNADERMLRRFAAAGMTGGFRGESMGCCATRS